VQQTSTAIALITALHIGPEPR